MIKEFKFNIKGTKIPELAYLYDRITQSSPKNILIIGEREGNEGVSKYTMEGAPDSDISCIDIQPICEGSFVDEMNKQGKLSFFEGDFTQLGRNQFDSIVCISVLEHFGMKFSGVDMFTDPSVRDDDVIKWNHDLRAIGNMITLLKPGGEAIITVPAGNYMNYDKNGFPFLRYYDGKRRDMIVKIVEGLGAKIENEQFAHSKDFVTWVTVGVDVMNITDKYFINPYSPNAIWNFTIRK